MIREGRFARELLRRDCLVMVVLVVAATIAMVMIVMMVIVMVVVMVVVTVVMSAVAVIVVVMMVMLVMLALASALSVLLGTLKLQSAHLTHGLHLPFLLCGMLKTNSNKRTHVIIREFIDHALAFAACHNQAPIAKKAQLMRNGGLRNVAYILQLAYALFAINQSSKDLKTGKVAQRVEDLRGAVYHCVIL